MSNITAEETTWLVEGSLAEKDVTVFVGEEGIGKGLWWIHKAKEVADAGHKILIIASEDDPGRAIRPRLDAAGISPEKVLLIIEDEETLTGHPQLPGHTEQVAEMIRDNDVKLLVLDPWASVVPSSLSLRDSQQARLALDPLTKLARREEIAVLVIVHTNRSAGSTRDRVGLTSVLRQVARILILALEDPDDETRIYVGIDKANGIARGSASSYLKSGTGSAWKVTVDQDDTGLTIRDWSARFATMTDGRTTSRWGQLIEAATSDGKITRSQIIEIYDGNPDSADKAIRRWKDSGRLEGVGQGVYQATGGTGHEPDTNRT